MRATLRSLATGLAALALGGCGDARTSTSTDASVAAADSGVGRSPTPVINEVACSGAPEYVELFNPGEAAAPLAGLRLADGPRGAGQALEGRLEPGAFLRVELAAGNRLRCGEERVFLARGDAILDAVSPPALVDGASWSRLPDGSGAFARGDRTPGAANRPFGEAARDVFAPLAAPILLSLSLDRDAQLGLQANPGEYVPARFTGLGDAPLDIGVRLKGRIGSFRGCPFDCGEKSALKLDFDRLVDGQTWRGLGKLSLNNQVQDPSRVREWLFHELARVAGLPAPRVGYAELRVNGEPWGLYLVLEGHDDAFFERHFASTRAVYEGSYGQDLFPEATFTLEQDRGDPRRAELAALIDALAAAPRGEAYRALAPMVDWPQVLGVMALELFTGHWDGYAATRNNYFLHADDAGVFRLIPWGPDQTFERPLEPLRDVQGLLLERCLEDVACLPRWVDALLAAVATARDLDVRQRLEALALHLQPFHEDDPRREYGPHDLAPFAHATADFVEARIAALTAGLACGEPDRDRDGLTCALDCDEDRPGVHFGAPPETCEGGANGRDDDCDGRVDDGPDCPACRDHGRLRLCLTPLSWDDAGAACAAARMQLVTAGTARQRDDLAAALAATYGPVEHWLGLTDRAEEGRWVWVDGAPLDTLDGFAPGEPNDAGPEGEDCAHARLDGPWNDLDCGAALPFVCEAP
jgi:hypothetical protein